MFTLKPNVFTWLLVNFQIVLPALLFFFEVPTGPLLPPSPVASYCPTSDLLDHTLPKAYFVKPEKKTQQGIVYMNSVFLIQSKSGNNNANSIYASS